jgi:hypothetical protein
MQSTSSGSHGSSNTIPPRAGPGPEAVGAGPPRGEAVGLARAPFGIDERVEVRLREPSAEAPGVRRVCVPSDVGAPMLGGGADPPIEGIGCTREIVDVDIAMVRIAAVGRVRVPMAGIDDGELVDAPIVGAIDVPIVETVVPIAVDDIAPNVCESVVRADSVVPSEVSPGSVAEGPIPNFAAKESKSVVAPKPRVASRASKAGSDAMAAIGAVSVGNVDVLALGTEKVGVVTPPVVVTPPIVVPELNVEGCACATQGIAMSATGAIHPMILCMPPPC